jgi:hypothetical protein
MCRWTIARSSRPPVEAGSSGPSAPRSKAEGALNLRPLGADTGRMSGIALRAEDFGKRHHVGHVPERHTLGENLVRVAGSQVVTLMNGVDPPDPATEHGR